MAADFDKISKWYDNYLNQIYFKVLYKKIIHFIHGYLKPGDKFLDVGCGTGNWLLRLKKDYVLDLYGLDKSQGMINSAAKKSSLINFNVGQSENLSFEDSEFNFVSIIEAFHHFENQKKSLTEAHRVLKNGGHILLIDPVLDGLAKIIWLGTKIFSFERDSKHFYFKRLIALIEKSGFIIEKAKIKFGNAWILAKKI